MRPWVMLLLLPLAGCVDHEAAPPEADLPEPAGHASFVVPAGDPLARAFRIGSPEGQFEIAWSAEGSDGRDPYPPSDLLVLAFALEEDARLVASVHRFLASFEGRDTEGHADHGVRSPPEWGSLRIALEDVAAGTDIGVVLAVTAEVPVRVDLGAPAVQVAAPFAADAQYLFQQTGGVNDLLVKTGGIAVMDRSSGPLHEDGHVREQELTYAWPEAAWGMASLRLDHWAHAGSWSARGTFAGQPVDESHALPPFTGRPDSPLTPLGPFQWGAAGFSFLGEGPGTELTIVREVRGVNDLGEYWTFRTLQLEVGPEALFGVPGQQVREVHSPDPSPAS